MKAASRVVWSEGMLMSPQHFQQQERWIEELVEQRSAGLVPYNWGAVTMELDERALESGHVALRAFFGVLPQGSVLRLGPGDSELPPSRPIGSHFPPQQQALDVYLALPIERVGSNSYARTELERGNARYVIETKRVIDVVSPEAEDAVDFARRNVQLLFGSEPREDMECLKIAEISRDGSGKLTLSGSYVVPALRVGVSAFLVDGFQRVLALASSRRRAVAEERHHRDSQAAQFGSDDVTRYLALHALSQSIPVLAHIAEGNYPPQQAYLCLVQLAGQLTAFSVDADPAALPAYLHNNLRETFEPLFATVTSLLRLAVASRVVTIPLEARADGLHLARIPDPALFKAGVRFVLCMQTSLPEQQVFDLVPRVAKLASWAEISRLVNAASPGVPMQASPRPPREIPMRTGRCHFLVVSDHATWNGVVQERAVAVHLPPPFDPKSTRLELLAIPRE